jgi:hypothetical protein
MANYTGSFSGSFQGTISGSLLGSGIVSGSPQIDFNDIVNKPTTIQPFQANSIVSNNRFREVTYPAISASTSTRFTTIEANVSTLSGQIQAAVSGTVPPGTISGSAQIAAFGYLTSASAAAAGFGSGGGGSTDISALNTFTGSAQTSLTALNSATSSFITNGQTSSMSVATASFISSTFISASAAASGFGSGGGETYTAGLGITITSNVITLNTSSTHFIQGVSASAAASGFGSGGGSNTAPTIADQSMSAVPESSSAGYEVGLITATDVEGNVITFGAFTISNVFLNSNPSVNLTSSLGGTSLFDPSIDPFQANSSGVITRKNSVFLNADVADRYVYLATATDAFSTATGSGLITIPISQDASSSIGNNGQTYFIIESATGSDNLTTISNGRTIDDVTFSSAVSQMWLVKSNPIGYVRFTNGTTQYTGSTSLALELAQNVSGSGLTFDSSSTIGIEITASETSFETTKQFRNHTLSIAKNFEPSGSMIPSSSNLNTNGARSGSTIATLTWTDAESNTLNNSTFTLTSNAGLSSSWNGSYVYTINATGSISAGTYFVSASVKDQHGFRFGSSSVSFTIVQAGTGSLTTNGTFYVIESAVSGNLIYTSTNGRSGTQGNLGVTYSPQYNSATVASFTSSDARIGINTAGNLSVTGIGISGSAGGSFPGTITPTVTWRDQYNNVGSGSITINIAVNNAPTVSLDNPDTDNQNTNLATTGTRLTRLTWADAESDVLSVQTFTLTGAGAASLSSSYNGSNIFGIHAASNLAAGTYGYTASIEDVFGFRTGSYKDIITIAQASSGSLLNPNTYYIVESAVSGNFITRDLDGSGSAASASVSYPAGIGNPTATNFSASDAFAVVTIHPTTAVLSINQNFSGSVSLPTEGNSFTARIFWNDIYQSGSGDINISVTNNLNPTASFANANLTAPVTTNTTLVTVTLTDPEVTTPFSMSLSGLSATSMSAVPQNVGSSSYLLKNSVDINDGVTLSYTASVFDAYNNQVNFNRQLTIGNPIAANPSIFIYASSRGAGSTLPATYNTLLGTTSTSGTPLYAFEEGNLGKDGATIPLTGGAMDLIFSGSGTDLYATISSSMGVLSPNFTVNPQELLGAGNKLIYIVYPSSSDLGSRPTSTTDNLSPGNTTPGQYTMWYDGGAGDESAIGSQLNNFTISNGYTGSDGTIYAAGQSYQSWTVMGGSAALAKFAGTAYKFFIVPSSGSDPTP